MNKEDKKLQKHLVDEMMKVSQTNPDVMYYMEVLMKSYEELEQKNIDLSQQLLSKKISDKDIEYKKRMKIQQELERYKNIIDEFDKWLVLQRDNLDKRVDEMETDDKNMARANHYAFIYNRVIDRLKNLKENNNI